MSSSKIFLLSCSAFIIGVFIAQTTQNAQIIIMGVLFLIGITVSLFFRKIIFSIICCFLFLTFGLIRADISKMKIINNDLQKFNKAKVVLTGTIIKEPEISQTNQKITVKPELISREGSLANPIFQSISNRPKGKILIYAPIFPKYQYGDYLKIKGELSNPPVFKDFDYKQYLAEQGIYSIMTNVRSINLEKSNKGNRLYTKILAIKLKLRNSIEREFPFSQAFLLKAMLLGDKSQLPQDLKLKLNKAGIRHLTAISGMHISILINFLMLIFLGLGLWRKHALWLTIIFVFFFILMTGCQPSAIRAGLMGFFLLLGQNFGRNSDASRMIIFGGASMLLVNPLYITQAGFQLSFLAVLGINYLFPIFSRWLRKMTNVFQIKNILAMSLSAQIFTLPILIHSFGYMSLVSPITNILVLPALPFILALGFLSALVGIFSYTLSLVFVFPCWFLLSYLLKITSIFSSFSFSSIQLRISWIGILFYYLSLIYLIWQWRRDHPFKILGF